MAEVRAEATWANALVHPARVRILRHLLHHGGLSVAPSELARRWDVDLSVLSNHFRRLSDLGVIELATRTASRGAAVNHYRLRDSIATADALWRFGARQPARDLTDRWAAMASIVGPPRERAVGRLRARREQVGFSQTTLARRIGIRAGHLGRIERGQCDPRLSVVLALADELDYPLEQLFGAGEATKAQAAR